MDQLQKHRESAARFRRQLAEDNQSMRKKGHPISRTFATEILLADENGNVQLRFEVDTAYTNFFGGVQGGVLAALIDEACAYAVVSCVGFHCFVSTAELQTRIFSKAAAGTIEAKARISHQSRYAVHAAADLYSGGERVAAGTALTLIDTNRPVPERPAPSADAANGA